MCSLLRHFYMGKASSALCHVVALFVYPWSDLCEHYISVIWAFLM